MIRSGALRALRLRSAFAPSRASRPPLGDEPYLHRTLWIEADAKAYRYRCPNRRRPTRRRLRQQVPPLLRLPTPEISNAVARHRVELFRIHNYRKLQPLGLRFRLVLTESDTKQLEWQMS
jgi:hypothetical protein